MPCSPALVADNIDTLILNVKLRQDFPLELAQQRWFPSYSLDGLQWRLPSRMPCLNPAALRS